MRAKRGHLIAVEGIDNAGKTTLISSINPALANLGLNVAILEEFSSTFGDYVYRMIVEQSEELPVPIQALLRVIGQYSSLAETEQFVEDPKGLVLIDRYIDTNCIYQSIKYAGVQNAYSEEANRFRVWVRNLYTLPHIEPDLIILLDIPVEESFKRSLLGRKAVTKSAEFLEVSRELFLQIAMKDPKRYKIIDGTSSIEEISQTAVTSIMHLVTGKVS